MEELTLDPEQQIQDQVSIDKSIIGVVALMTLILGFVKFRFV